MPESPFYCRHYQCSGNEPEQGGILGDYANEWERLVLSTRLATSQPVFRRGGVSLWLGETLQRATPHKRVSKSRWAI
jgi:hypothetical protein